MENYSGCELCRENINYILVYNEGKYGKAQKSAAREQNYNYFMKLAQQEERLFEIDKFEKYLFNKTHTYTKRQFEEFFVQPKEQEEEYCIIE